MLRKKKLGSIIFLENSLSLHNVTVIFDKVSSVRRPLDCSSEGGIFLALSTPAAQLHHVPVSCTSVGCSNWQSHIFTGTGLWTTLSPPFPLVLKPVWDLQRVNKSSASSETFSAGTAGIWKLLLVVFRQSRVWQVPRRRNASPASLASLGLTFSRNGEQEFC